MPRILIATGVSLYLALLLLAAALFLRRSLCRSFPHGFFEQLHGLGTLARSIIAAILICATAIGGSKTNSAPERLIGQIGAATMRVARQILGHGESTFTLAEVRTNGVAIAAQPASAVVSERLLRRGTSEGGEWDNGEWKIENEKWRVKTCDARRAKT